MSAIPPTDRIEISSAVKAILESDSQKSQFFEAFVRYLQALLAPDPARVSIVS